MHLIPLPQKISKRTGTFSIDHETDIILNIRQDDVDFQTAIFLRNEIEKIIAVALPIKKDRQSEKSLKHHSISFEYPGNELCEEAYRLVVAEKGITIWASSNRGFLYGAVTLIQLCKLYKGEIACMEIEDEPSFPNRGYLLDVSRGRIPTMDTLRNLVDKLAFYKINQLQLYVEDS
ncbi:MAG: glycoside hydrolase family 20 zincin-like fold domain-containing protein, partial [Eubacteriales bacterium]|nr:glycoside hydrolase family 20 zincin-like fold domain-containing protein [Eubacteriales bacterium]